MINIRGSTNRERELGCNTCEEDQENGVEVVVELGRNNTLMQVRMCQGCFLNLRETVEGVYGWDVFRATW